MFVISLTLATYAPNVDKDMTIHYYVRSREQDEQLGLLEVCNTTVMLLTWLDPLHPMGGTARAATVVSLSHLSFAISFASQQFLPIFS